FVGGLLPYLFGALALVAVGCAAALLAKEANRQLGAVGGFGSTSAPQYGRCMDVAVRSAIRRTMLLVLLPLSIPLAAGLMGGKEALGSLLVGAIVTGLFQAIAMTSGGGAWDSARRYIEDGMYGGSESDAYRAAVTGDMVGGACKDAAGSAIGPLIKLMGVVSVLIVPLLA
ncbi:MAG: sodium/proton-translocating pyrophosphatase, partial [Methylococcus sp.]|nr:sodium/proton-translocating pyrophosphatase [Methylococcus sp.]